MSAVILVIWVLAVVVAITVAAWPAPRGFERDGIDSYRIGAHPLQKSLPYRLLHHPDRWRRSWQAEWDIDCRWAPRAWTRAGVERKAARWRARAIDTRKAKRAAMKRLWRAK